MLFSGQRFLVGRHAALLRALLLLALALASAAQAAVTVHSGDTLYSLSQRVGLSVEQLRRINHLRGSALKVGQVLKTNSAQAQRQSAQAQRHAPRPQATHAGGGRYTVRRGDTLGSIAGRCGLSVTLLMRANHLSRHHIKVGQVLYVPPRSWKPAHAPHPRPKQHPTPKLPPYSEERTVYSYMLAGQRDTFRSLLAKSNLSRADFMRLNHLAKPQIFAGTRLLMPRHLVVSKPPTPLRPPAQFIRAVVGGVGVSYIKVDLRHKGVLVSPILPRWGLGGGGARVGTLARSSRAVAVINGSYFDPGSYVPAGDLVVAGQQLAQGRLPTALAITPDNRASIGRVRDWHGMETVIASGPQIVRGGAVQSQFSRIFRDPAVFAPARRSALGLLSSRDLILVTTQQSLTAPQMGRVMQALGARDALLLDGGSSTGLAYRGRAIHESTRSVAYGIGVFLDYQGRRWQHD